jgi:hypothetical protein
VVTAVERPGVPPDSPWTCPDTHPIKGYVLAESEARLYYLPGSRFYAEASPERCYATETDAQQDGGRPAATQTPEGPANPGISPI